MNEKSPVQKTWSENTIIVDADYIDRVAFNLIVNFERMLMRKIPCADLSRWLDGVALDGGMRPVEREKLSSEQCPEVHVVLIHDKQNEALENFLPANYEKELNAKAFKDTLGEFIITTIAVEALTNKDDLLLEIVHTVVAQKEVKRIMIVPNADEGDIYSRLRQALRGVDDDKRITLFAMQPMAGGNFRQEILGYSLMNALGIRAEELH